MKNPPTPKRSFPVIFGNLGKDVTPYSSFEKYGYAGDDFLKGDLYEAWLDTLGESILDENFEPLFDERVKEVRT